MEFEQPRRTKGERYDLLEFNQAESFLEELGRTSELWQPPQRTPNGDSFPTWIFRGHSQANWKLLPSVLRDKNYYINLFEQISNEADLLKNFHNICQIYGLAIAEDSQNLHTLDRHIFNSWCHGKLWPPRELYSLCAHAQHYGIPTRLLDWSWDPLIAMYFAAQSAVNKINQGTQDQFIAVWALNTELMHFNDLEPPHIQLVTAPAAEIPNLAAQKGVFTLITDLYGPDNQNTQRHPLEEIIRSYHQDPKFPAQLIKATLPYSQVKRLFYLLSRQFVTAASVYPGYEGVVKYLLKELNNYDIPDDLLGPKIYQK